MYSVEEVLTRAAADLGYKEVFPKQALVMRNFISVFVSLPTEFGKSLCYCILPSWYLIFARWSQCNHTSSGCDCHPSHIINEGPSTFYERAKMCMLMRQKEMMMQFTYSHRSARQRLHWSHRCGCGSATADDPTLRCWVTSDL